MNTQAIKDLFSDPAESAEEENAEWMRMKEALEEKLKASDAFLRVARSADAGKLLEQRPHSRGLEKAYGSCECGGEQFYFSREEDVGVIFDAKMQWIRYLVCFGCRTARRIG